MSLLTAPDVSDRTLENLNPFRESAFDGGSMVLLFMVLPFKLISANVEPATDNRFGPIVLTNAIYDAIGYFSV